MSEKYKLIVYSLTFLFLISFPLWVEFSKEDVFLFYGVYLFVLVVFAFRIYNSYRQIKMGK